MALGPRRYDGRCVEDRRHRTSSAKSRATWLSLAGLLTGAVGCAGAESGDAGTPFGLGAGGPTSGGIDDSPATKGDEPNDGFDDELGDDADDDDGSDDGPVSMPPDLGPCDSNDDCMLAAGFCLRAQGVCDGGMCVHEPEPSGVICDDGDGCTTQDMCDGAGACIGSSTGCAFDNASGGSCNAGACQGMTCDAGWGNCDDDWTSNGCETSLDTESDCGGCGEVCVAGDNATAMCNDGQCELDCSGAYEDCDGDPANGCEIPTGIANQCDAGGLNAVNGCWTAHCGTSMASGAMNFGTWYCYDCTTCNVPSAGQCQWCSHDTGNWFPAESGCACGSFEGQACEP